MIDLSFLGRRSKQLAGLDISSSSVKLLELSGSEQGGYRIEGYATEVLPRDAVVDGNIANLDAVSDAIRRAAKRMGGNLKQVAVALPTASVITKLITLPGGLRESEMEMQVESEASQYIPFALDEVNLDFQVVRANPDGDVQVMIAASRKEKVEDRVAVVESAGLKAMIVDSEAFAARAAFDLVRSRLPEEGRDQVLALVNIGATVTAVSILRDGDELYSREQPCGGHQLTQEIAKRYGKTPDEAELAKRNGSLEDDYEQELMRPFMDNVALEIARALQFFFTSTQFNEVHHIVLAGGCAVLPGLGDMVAGRTQVACTVANPFEGMVRSSQVRSKALKADAPSMLVACGLALRKFDS